MNRRFIAVMLCAVLVFTMASCSESKEEKAKEEKAKQEEIRLENEAAANYVTSSIESLPDVDKLTLKDEPAVNGARAIYDELTEDQKKLVSYDNLTKLEDSEQKISELISAEEERQRNMKEDKKAARQTEEVIDGIPDKITLDAEASIEQARASYNQLTDDQKSYVKKSAVEKLTSSEKALEKLIEEEQKRAEEEEKKAAEKAKKKKAKKAEKKENKEEN